MTLKEKIDALRTKAEELDLACLVYAFEDSDVDASNSGMGGGFDRKADMGDALVAIKRIVKRFKIDTGALAVALGE